jgi:hypothetical protein
VFTPQWIKEKELQIIENCKHHEIEDKKTIKIEDQKRVKMKKKMMSQ